MAGEIVIYCGLVDLKLNVGLCTKDVTSPLIVAKYCKSKRKSDSKLTFKIQHTHQLLQREQLKVNLTKLAITLNSRTMLPII